MPPMPTIKRPMVLRAKAKSVSGQIILITGGIRSGKSRYALEYASTLAGQRAFVATAEPLDEEMRRRIDNHKRERGPDFVTIEEPLYLAETLARLQNDFDVVLVDCLSLWLNNLFYHWETNPDRQEKEIDHLMETVSAKKKTFLFVTNETGWGTVPDNALTRRYVDELGALNQRLGRLADEIIWMVCGIPQKVKGALHAEP